MTYSSIIAFYRRIECLAERIVSGSLACVRIALFASVWGLVFGTFPNYPQLWDEEYQKATAALWNAVLDKRDHLFMDLSKVYGIGSHQANANYRLTVPLIAKLLGLSKLGIFVFQSLCGVLLLWIVARIVVKITKDPVASLFITCGVASTWAGATSFSDLNGMFDGQALLLLSCAVLAEASWSTGLFVFLGAWTDERALIASSLVYVYHVNRLRSQGASSRASYFGATAVGMAVAGIAYSILRIAMGRYYHLLPPTGPSLKYVILDASNLPIGSWTALEGGWLLAAAAAVTLAKERRITLLILYMLGISSVLAVAMSVVDITRSMAYALPAIFVAIAILRDKESSPDLRALCAVSSAVSILWPNYYCFAETSCRWLVPLPIRILHWYFLGARPISALAMAGVIRFL